MINTENLELDPPEKERDEEWRTRREFTGWNNCRKTEEAPHKWNWCSKEAQAPGRRGWEGRKTKATWKGKSTNILNRKHWLKSLWRESKNFTRLGWILDYGLLFQEEKGGPMGKKTTEDWTQRWRGSSRLDEKCTGSKELRNNDRKTNCVNLKKVWKGREVIQNTYVKIPYQSDEGDEE